MCVQCEHEFVSQTLQRPPCEGLVNWRLGCKRSLPPPDSSVPTTDPSDAVVKSESHLGLCPWPMGSKSVLGLVNAHFHTISPTGHGSNFTLKHPLRAPHSGASPLPNPFGAAWTPSESRRHMPRCDAATAPPSPRPGRPPSPSKLELWGAVEPRRDRGVAPSQGGQVVCTATTEIESALRLSNEPFSTIPTLWAPCQQRRRSGRSRAATATAALPGPSVTGRSARVISVSSLPFRRETILPSFYFDNSSPCEPFFPRI